MSLRKHRCKVTSQSIDQDAQALFDAVKTGDLSKVKQLIDIHLDLDLDKQDENGCTCLGLAAQHGYPDVLEHLLQQGAGVNTADFYGQTALHFASEFGKSEAAAILIKAGANVDWMDVNNDGLSAIHIAACKGQTEVAKQLIEAGCKVNVQDIKGVSVLHCAVANGHYNIAAALLKAGARSNLAGSETHRTPLFLACEVANLPMAKLLVDYGAKVNVQDNYGMTPLCAVCIQDNSEMAEFLIKAGTKVNLRDNKLYLPIHYTARNSNVHLTEMLLDNGSEVDVLNKFFESPLHLAVRMGHMEVVRLLVDRGCDVNICSEEDHITPLHAAVNCYSDCTTFLMLLELLEAGDCDLDAVMINSWTSSDTSHLYETPLYRAIDAGKSDIALTLLQHGADPNVECPHDLTVLHKACHRLDVAVIDALLLHCGIRWAREEWLDVDIHHCGINRDLLAGQIPDIPPILRCDVNVHEAYGCVTPLHGAVDVYTEVPAFTEVLELLLEGDCDVNVRAYSSLETPVHRAMKQGNIGVALVLLQHGADPCVPTLDDSTALQIACSKGERVVAETILHAGIVDWKNNTWLRDIEFQIRPRLLPYFVKDIPWNSSASHEEMIKHIMDVRKNPVSLLRTCRTVIRNTLGSPLHYKINKLHLPKTIIEFLMLRIL